MTSKKIKQSTLELISQRGYSETTLSLIAKRVGIKKPSIYSHFQSKEDIFFSILEDETKNLNMYIESIFDDIKKLDLEEMLYQFICKFVKYFDNNIVLAKFWNIIMYFPPNNLEQNFKLEFDIIKNKINKFMYTSIKEKINSEKFDKEKMENIIYSYELILRGILTMIIYDDNFTIDKIERICAVYCSGIKKEIS
ncbi:TetR/AcrR family transcriptional regulator [Tepidibacter mesophilus]|uniref:TetR/AcrR family transcriptional regulator n=1 Tax=Tepidibacter mesophilus TaxID=655607 RepID=UPI0016518827|nr:TetR/AcrR family transcriptional regulator [Tepidibacter mesophilus]